MMQCETEKQNDGNDPKKVSLKEYEDKALERESIL
jgi:hypothetical protein